MNGWSWYWLGWLLIGFCVPEFYAIFQHRYRDTLSENVWRLTDTVPGSTPLQWTALHVFVAAFMVWLCVHIVLGFWR